MQAAHFVIKCLNKSVMSIMNDEMEICYNVISCNSRCMCVTSNNGGVCSMSLLCVCAYVHVILFGTVILTEASMCKDEYTGI